MSGNEPIGRKTVLSEINVTPLVDVMMVLLVIFMVTAPLVQQGIFVNIPKASAQPLKTYEEPIVLTITKEGQIYISGYQSTKQIDLNNLQDYVSKLYANRQTKEIFLRADEKVYYGFLVKVASVIKKGGVEKVGMITEAESINSSAIFETPPKQTENPSETP